MEKNFKTRIDQSEQTRLAFSVEELTKVLPISRQTAYNLVHTEGFPLVRIGQRLLVPKAGLEHWLAEQTALTAQGDRYGEA